MLQKVFKIIIHPIFIYAIIAFLECIPFYPNAPKVVLHEMPKAGDNFGIPNSEAVFYYSGKGKYAYTSGDCYFSHGNPTFDISYKEGGIKTIDKVIADKIPFLGSMCDDEKKVTVKNNSFEKGYFFSTNFLLYYFSGVSHIICYFVLALSCLYYLRSRKNKYLVTFLAIFIGGAVLEFVQEIFIMGRNASIEDQVSNCFGAVLGMLLFWMLLKTRFFQKMI
jgi:VanZ family protein